MNDLPFVDAHHHFWDPIANNHPWLRELPMIPFRYGDYGPIRRPYLPDDYFADAKNHTVVKTVLMEGEWTPDDPLGEARWVSALADRTGFPNAMVSQAWMDADNVAEVLKGLSAFPLVRSVRHKPKASASPAEVRRGAPGSMGDPKWRAGFALLDKYNLMFDLQTPYWHLEEAAELARDFPKTTIILNHTGLPADRSAEGLAAWRDGMRSFASQPNVAVKISGIGLKGRPWTIDDNRSIVLDTIEIFGVDRCMFASNFPVDSVCADYDTIIGGFKAITADFDRADRMKLFHDNAIRIYRLAR